ncbi:MAG: hypothetical protein GVY19_12530 [Bacteroidetes bacterium]|jgi:hypothetical protein|nr:hypothetical protein [Bacteroidota bacterium]
MYTNGSYPKTKETLGMLSHTFKAYLRLKQYGFDIEDPKTHENLQLTEQDYQYISNEIDKSLEFGSYSINQKLDSLNFGTKIVKNIPK